MTANCEEAMAKKIARWQAAETIGISARQMRRWQERLEAFGYGGLFDRRRGQPFPKASPSARNMTSCTFIARLIAALE